jgi:transposase
MRRRSPKRWSARICVSCPSRQRTSSTCKRCTGCASVVSRRTSVINQIRAFLLERGISLAKGPARLRREMPEIVENADEKLSARLRRLLDFLWQEWKHRQLQIESLNEDLEKIADSDAACTRLQQIPGVGPLVATAVVSAIGNGAAFHKGREFAAWLGRVPGQWSTGGKTKLLGISKRGNPYLRKMFIPGARAAVLRVKREGSSLGQWMGGLESRAARNVVIVATANKLARISWAVLSSGNDYRPMHPAVDRSS